MERFRVAHGNSALEKWDVSGCMITDPPYSAHVHASATSCATTAKNPGPRARKNDLGFTHRGDDLLQFTCGLAAQVKRWSVIFTDIESVGDYKAGLESAGAKYIRAIPWVRWSMPQLSGDRPPQGSEMVVIAYGCGGGRKHWNGPGNLTHFTHLALRGAGKHKSEKPLDLMLDLVKWFSDAGEMVIDPFAGSGTTGVACALLGRNFSGCELDAEWAVKANARLTNGGTGAGIALSERDQERYDRWLVSDLAVEAGKERCRAHTAKIRAKFETHDAT